MYYWDFNFFAKVLCDLGSSINMMSLIVFKQLGLEMPKPTLIRLLITNCTVKKLMKVLHNVLVEFELFIFLSNFVIFNCGVDFKVPTILEGHFSKLDEH